MGVGYDLTQRLYDNGHDHGDEQLQMSPWSLDDVKQKWEGGACGVLQPSVRRQWVEHNKKIAVVSVSDQDLPAALRNLKCEQIQLRNAKFDSIVQCQVCAGLLR